MKFQIKIESLPLHFLVLGWFLVIFNGVSLFISADIIFNLILLIVGILLVASQQRVELDLEKKLYSEYYWVLGLRLSQTTEEYSEMLEVILAEGNYSQEYGKYNRRFISGTMFKGYIVLKDQEHIFIGQNKGRKAMERKIIKLADKLKLPYNITLAKV